MIYEELTESQMHHTLMSDEYANWTYEQAQGIVDFFMDMYGDDENYQWDVVAIRCEFSGYESIEEAEDNYILEEDESLEDVTLVIFCDDGHVVVQDY